MSKLKQKWNKRVVLPFRQNKFLFEELVKRDFKRRYKGTVLGMLWSVIYPLLHLLVMRLVFTQFFGRNTPHYTTYLFCGILIFHYFKESTHNGMSAILNNANVLSKIRVPKYLFLLSKNVSCSINFAFTLVIFFIFAAFDHIQFRPAFFALVYPIAFLIIFNIGVGMILSVLYVFFRDMSYLYDLFTLLLRYMSAIFYRVDSFPENVQGLFMINPVYCYIKYFRVVCVDGGFPTLNHHILCAAYAVGAVIIGAIVYKKNNTRIMYYL